MLTRDVFVAGGQPTITYIPREAENLEARLVQGLEAGFTLISLTGPTKSGKTVLCRKVLPKEEAIWVSGGTIASIDDFWEQLIDAYDLSLESEETAERGRSSEIGAAGKVGLNLGVVKAESGASGKEVDEVRRGSVRRQVRSKKAAALKALEDGDKVLVVDDFHYIDKGIQIQIVRSLKQLIFDGLRVVFLAVPHRAYDAVRVEREMTARVTQISIPYWSQDELRLIAEKGASALNVEIAGNDIHEFAEEAFGSPHLMQRFCHSLCINNEVRETLEKKRILSTDDKERFFGSIAVDTAKSAFERLAKGPRARSDRIQREFRTGETGDIYYGVLKAIAASGPKTTLSYEEIRQRFKEILIGDVPQAHEITRVIQKMSGIAKEDLQGEPVLDWDEEESRLHLVDPFFAYYLKWGELVPRESADG